MVDASYNCSSLDGELPSHGVCTDVSGVAELRLPPRDGKPHSAAKNGCCYNMLIKNK